MQTNMVRQPILNRSKDVVGYEILYQDVCPELHNQAEVQAAKAIEEFLLQVDMAQLLEEKVAYLTFPPNLLLKNIPERFEPGKLVIQIDGNSIVHPLTQRALCRYKKQGYRVAFTGFEFVPRYSQFMDLLDIIKVDLAKYHETSLNQVVAAAQSFGKELIAYHVDSPEAYGRACGLGIQYMQGSAVAPALSINRDAAGNVAISQ